ncbi:DUF4124 domain-containing protein [Halomonadaceae bacterium KBTZ08]
MPHQRLSAFVAALTVVLVAPCRAELYTWTDDQGVTHFTDERPEAEAHQEKVRPDLVNSPARLPEPGTWAPEHTDDTEEQDREQIAREREKAAQERRCREYEARLKQINDRLRSGYQEPTGNRLREERRALRSKVFNEC